MGDAKTGLLKLRDGVIKVNESGLFGFVENRKRSCNLQASANSFLAAGVLIHEHHICMNFRRERDCLTLSWIELPKNELHLGLRTSTHAGALTAQSCTGFGASGCLEFCQHSGRNKNSRVRLLEEINASDQDEVVDR